METRKLQQVGGGTYTVSIPKSWIREQELEAGDRIHLYPHTDDSLLVRASKKDDEELARTTVDVEAGGPALLRRALTATHAVGYDTVTLSSSNGFSESERRAVSEITRDLVGMEIVSESENTISVHNLLDGTDFSVRQSVVQLQYIATSTVQDGTAALLTADGSAVERLQDRSTEGSRLFDVLSRNVNRTFTSMEALDSLGISRSSLFDYYVTASHLADIIDHALAIGEVGSDLPDPLPESLGRDIDHLSDDLCSTVEHATTAMLESESDRAHDALDTRTDVESALGQLRATLQEESVRPDLIDPISRSSVHLSEVAEAACAIADVAIAAELRAEAAPTLGPTT